MLDFSNFSAYLASTLSNLIHAVIFVVLTELSGGFSFVAGAARAAGGGRGGGGMPFAPLAPGPGRSAANGSLAFEGHLVQLRFVRYHLEVVQICLHAPDHLRFFEHFLRVRRLGGFFSSFYGCLTWKNKV